MKRTDVRLLLLDVDGVLTDGVLTLHDDGSESKHFHVHDGQGLVAVMNAGILIAVISHRQSQATAARLNELGITEVVLGADDKFKAACTVLKRLKIDWTNTVCVGDDVADRPLIEAAGLGVAVADARGGLQDIADWTVPSAGGHGAVRDVCDWILDA